jgi:hypothetical protein
VYTPLKISLVVFENGRNMEKEHNQNILVAGTNKLPLRREEKGGRSEKD